MGKENDYKELIDNLLEEAKAVAGIEWEIPICTADHIREAAEAIKKLQRDLKDCRNELCLKCGNYKFSHCGNCDGCRWKI